MKKHLIIAVIACASSLALCQDLHAQGGGGGGGGGAGRQRGGGGQRGGGMNIATLTTALTLTPDEVTAITPILDQAQKDRQALMADTTTPQADRRTKGQAIREAANAKINALLTPDQQKKFADLQAAQAARRAQYQNGGGAGGGAAAASPAAPATTGS